MQLFRGTLLLFTLNLLDALLTIVWVRSGVATEGNHLMATLLDIGDFPFLMVKLLMGAVTAFVLLRWNYIKIARYGLSVALAAYISLMGIHLFTGLTAFGYVSNSALDNLSHWSQAVFAFFLF
ncbi:MAG: DUF5658 family protein [Pyrinomonadaceae bacterium]